MEKEENASMKIVQLHSGTDSILKEVFPWPRSIVAGPKCMRSFYRLSICRKICKTEAFQSLLPKLPTFSSLYLSGKQASVLLTATAPLQS